MSEATPPLGREPRLQRQRQPLEMAVDDWQRALRRQFGREQRFGLDDTGSESGPPTFRVRNDPSGTLYEVAIRGAATGDNSCTCPDFRTNELGTCKHIEFVLARLAARRGGKAALARAARPHASEIYLRHGAERVVCWRPGSGCPPRLLQRAARLFDGERLEPERYPALDAFIAAARRSSHELLVREDVLAHVAAWRDARRRDKVFAEAFPRGATGRAMARLLKARLYPYQAEGALFAARAGRALIGDDMGLGKTVQAIAAAELMARHLGVRRVLVVCPVSLKHQWQREFERFSGRRAHVVQGLRAERGGHWRAEAFAHIVNYEVLARDLDLIRALDPELLIVDEAQRVKNWNTVAARALRRIDAPYALVLTGTPLQNRLEELIAIVQLVDQHRLGPTWRLLHEHQQRDETGRVIGYVGLDRLAATLAPVMLRRRKAEVLAQLPGRIDNTLLLPMTPQQRVHHDENGDIVARIVKRWRQTGFLSDADQLRLTCALQNMRMACNSTWLLDRETDHGTKADELMTLLEDLLADPQAKVVIFSQWVRTHEILAPRLARRGIGHLLFHGGVPGDRRGELVERFHQDPQCRAFLSTDAGGVGLNLQHAAAVVVNMDLPWNPAVLEQRIGRVHRMGQRRSVQVVNLVAQGSIEESMLGLLAFKKSLFAGVLDGGAGEVTLQGSRLARFMNAVDEATRGMPAAETGTEAPPAPPAPPDAAEAGARGGSDVDATEVPSPPAQEPDTEAAPAAVAPATEPAELPQPWAPLIDAGLTLLQQLAQAARDPSADTPWVQTDPASGARWLRLPLPEPATLRRLAQALTSMADQLPR